MVKKQTLFEYFLEYLTWIYLFPSFLSLSLFFLDRVFLHFPGYSGTHYVTHSFQID